MTNSFTIENLTRADLRGLQPYEAHYAPGAIRMDANENPHDFPPQVKEYILSQIGPQFFCRYPDSLSRDLVSEIAQEFGLESGNVLVGNGSDEIILNIMLAFGKGRKVIIASPTFSMYGIHAKIAGAEPVDVPRGPAFEVDVDAMIKAEENQPGVMILCTPNNPTGNATSLADIETLARSVKSLLVVDEAYIEFGGESSVSLLGKYSNLIIMRTFSKAFGLAGLRIGYALGSPAIIRELMRIKQPFNVNSFTQMAARSVIRYKEVFKERIGEIAVERDKLMAAMEELPGVYPYPTVANYILFRTDKAADQVHRQLIDRGVLVRFLELPGRGDFLRVTVGTEEENATFISQLKQIV